MNFLLISLGAIFGSSLRYIFTLVLVSPYGVLLANILGSFIAGVAFVLINEKMLLSEAYRLALIVGFCGSLTTLSAFSLDSFNMLSAGNYGIAIVNIISNILLSLLAIGLGVYLAKLF